MKSIAQPCLNESAMELAEAQRQLVQQFAKPILREVAREVLDGRTVIGVGALLRALPYRIRRKRPSVCRGVLAITLAGLYAQGHLPAEIRVVR